jgi:phosphonate transport system substrate-binding protein
MASNRSLRIAMFLLGLMVLAATQVAVARGEAPDKKPIYLSNLQNIYSGLSAKDAMLAFQVLMTKVMGAKYPDFEILMDFSENIDEALVAIENNRCDIMTLSSLDFFRMRRKIRLEPLTIISKGDHPTEPYLFLIPVDTSLETLIRKTDRRLIVEQSGGGDVATAWLTTLLIEHGLSPTDDFFATIRPAKPSRTVLPLFFGQADACVVSESTFNVMGELNPQVEKKIRILYRSPGFVNLLVGATQNLAPEHRRWVLDELATLNNSPEGQQALTIMQMKRFFLSEPNYLKATEALYERHRQLLGRQN